jgi:predicted transcriptional regulator
MSDLLDDRTNLLLLQEICAGNGLEVNLTQLSKRLKRHRNTIRERVRSLLSHRVIDRPVVPFLGLFRERPLLVVVYADLPEDARVSKWIKEDMNIFGAYRIREGDYNMMLFEFHSDVWSYHVWRDSLVPNGKIPARTGRSPSDTLYLSNRLITKYQPSTAIRLIEEQFGKSREIVINDCVLDKLALDVLKCLLEGKGIKVNENALSKKIGVHRSTIRRRIWRMEEMGLIHRPLCRFPLLFTPANFLLVFSMLEVKDPRKFINDIANDPHVSLAYNISKGRFNTLLFESHADIESYLRWESSYESKYPGCFGSIKNNYLSPRMTISIDQQKVSLGIIAERLKELDAKPHSHEKQDTSRASRASSRPPLPSSAFR